MQINATRELETYVRSAVSAGLPDDQTRNFVLSGYVALRWALSFHAMARECDREDGPVMAACGGARGPGKSYAIMAQIGLDYCQRMPGLKALYLRKVQKSASESFDEQTRMAHALVRERQPRRHWSRRFQATLRQAVSGRQRDEDALLPCYLSRQPLPVP